MPSQNTAADSNYEWRVVYWRVQVGGIAAGEHTHACVNRDHALSAYAHFMGSPYVTSVRIERRQLTTWESFDLEAEAERVR